MTRKRKKKDPQEEIVEPCEFGWKDIPDELSQEEILEMGKAQGGMINLSEIYFPDRLVEVLGWYYYNWGARIADAMDENSRTCVWEYMKRELIRTLLVYKREIPWWLEDEKIEKEEREYLRKLGFDV